MDRVTDIYVKDKSNKLPEKKRKYASTNNHSQTEKYGRRRGCS